MRFYFTVHPGDLMRTRIPSGADIMIVASAFWDERRQRLVVRRPPAGHIGRFSADSGGFTAAARWGRYPWSIEQYVEWLLAMSRDVPLEFAASMDYACERGVNREELATNIARIDGSIENELALREYAPSIPWLGVSQGNTLAERRYDLQRRRQLRLLSPILGIGSICGRRAAEAAAVIRFYHGELPRTEFHAFGMDCRTLDVGDDVATTIASWDSYAWNWPRGPTSARPGFLTRGAGESWSSYTRRLGDEYWRHTVLPRIDRPRQLSLLEPAA